jgi:DNA-binding LytR/AlgR family response regulator
MRVLIADDEPLALRRLETGLLCIPEVELVGAAKSGPEALALIRDLKPDVAILDINMPGLDGVGVVERLRADERVPEIIFATAFDKHALRAFELCAVDYLAKPVPFERLRDAVVKVQQRVAARNARERFAELQALIVALQDERGGTALDNSIWVRTRDSMARLSGHDITCIKALGDYVEIVAGEDVYTLRESISAMIERLDSRQFVRCHRSAIVNTREVKAVRRGANGKFSLHLKDGSSLPIGPNYADAVLEAVKGKRWRWSRSL